MSRSGLVKPIVKKRRNPDEISSQPPKKPAMPIVQLMPPPQKVRIQIESLSFNEILH